MLAVLITLTPGRRNEFIDCPNAKVCIAVLPITDVKTRWNSALQLLEPAYRFREFTCEWLRNPKYTDYRPLFTTQDEWTIVKYVKEVLRPFRCWTLRMSTRHTVQLHHVITLYNDMFGHMDGVMRALAKKKTPWKEDLFFAVKLARQKLPKYSAEVTPTTGMLLISAHILDLFRKLWSFRKWNKGMDINVEDETSYTTQYQEGFLKYVENEYCTKHRHVPINKHESLPSSNLITSTTASGFYQSSFDPYDLSSDDEAYITPNDVAETKPGWSYCAARLLTTARLYLNLPPVATKNVGQIKPNGHSQLVASTGGNPHKVRRSFQCGARHLLYHTTWCRSGGQFVPWPRCYRPEAVKNHRRDPSCKCRCKAVCSSQYHDFSTRWPRIEYNEHRKWHRNEEMSGRKAIAQNGEGSRLFGDLAGQPKPKCYPGRNLALKTSRWPLWDTFWTRKISSKHHGHSPNMMVRLHSNCPKDLLFHHLCLQRTSLEDKLKY